MTHPSHPFHHQEQPLASKQFLEASNSFALICLIIQTFDMRLLVLGASGRTGSIIVEDAVTRGHQVTALVRKASSLQPRDGLAVVQGTPLKQADIEKAFNASASDPVQVVIVALNAARASDSPFAKPLAPPNFIRDCVRNTTAVMAHHGVRRIVLMSAFGIGSSLSELPWLTKALFKHTNMSYQINDHHETDAEVRANESVDWTLVRPTMLKEGEAGEVKQWGEFGKGVGLLNGITRASVARFLVQVAEDTAWSKKAVVISN